MSLHAGLNQHRRLIVLSGVLLVILAVQGWHKFQHRPRIVRLPVHPAPQIACGAGHALVLAGDGTLWAWGANEFHQLGTDAPPFQPTIVQVGHDNDWTAVSAGQSHSLAIKRDGTLWGWGYNAFGQLGDGSLANRPYPTRIGSNLWKQVSAGLLHTVAIRDDGSLWAWGRNQHGQAGDGTTTRRITPTRVGDDAQWINCAAGHAHTVALKADGSLWLAGKLGGSLFRETGANTAIRTLDSGADWESIACGLYDVVARRRDGSLWTWFQESEPAPVADPAPWKTLAAGWFHHLAIRVDGTLWAWGESEYGKLGPAANGDRAAPVQVGVNRSWIAAGAGQHVSVAIADDGAIWNWGEELGTRSAGMKRVEERARYRLGLPVKRYTPHSPEPRLVKADWRPAAAQD